jgi:hypothetical protein
LEGEAQLTDSSGNLITEIDGDWAIKENTSGYSHTFNEDEPDSWAVSASKLTDIESERDGDI